MPNKVMDMPHTIMPGTLLPARDSALNSQSVGRSSRSNGGGFSGASGGDRTVRRCCRSTCGFCNGASGVARSRRSSGYFTGATTRSFVALSARRRIIHRVCRSTAALQGDGHESESDAEDKHAAHLHREEIPERLQEVQTILKLCKRFA